LELFTREITFVKRPIGMVQEDSFRMEDRTLPALDAGDILVRVRYLSVDPYMRGRMNLGRSYAPPFELGSVMVGGGVGTVEQSRNPQVNTGDWVVGQLPWADYCVAQGTGVRVLDDSLPPTSALHVLGMTGLTAYFGLLQVGQAKSGDVVVISGAAGAVGSQVGQIAKIIGCQVIGIAGSDVKTQLLKDTYGFDGTINYKTQNVREQLAEICPTGVDVYFDNVGGDVSDAVVSYLNDFSRIAICGQISLYNAATVEMGPRTLLPLLLTRRATARGFIVSDFAPQFGEALKQLQQWYQAGQLRMQEDVVEGLQNAPQALIRLFRGENVGKQLVHLP
jgi:NADPH-dependent curcumin reductase CurA